MCSNIFTRINWIEALSSMFNSSSKGITLKMLVGLPDLSSNSYFLSRFTRGRLEFFIVKILWFELFSSGLHGLWT